MQGPELLTPEEMGRADRLAIAAGVPGLDAHGGGGACRRRCCHRAASPAKAPRSPCCADPATTAATASWRHGCCGSRVTACVSACWAHVNALTGDAAAMARRWDADIEALTPAMLRGADLVIDAMFGAGLSRPLDGIAGRSCGRDQRVGQAGAGGRRAERTRRLDRRCAGPRRGAGDAHRHVLPHEARASAAAGAARCAARCGWPTSASPSACCRRWRRGPSLTAPRCGVQLMRFRASMRTNTRAGTRSSCRAQRKAPALPGSARAARCASAPAS